jgi:hypothetical protein
MLTCAPWVRSLCIPFPSERDALPKEGGKIARDKRENEEQQTFDSHVGINLISVRSSSDQKCTYLQRALILSRVKLKRGGLNPCSAKFTIKILKSGAGVRIVDGGAPVVLTNRREYVELRRVAASRYWPASEIRQQKRRGLIPPHQEDP